MLKTHKLVTTISLAVIHLILKYSNTQINFKNLSDSLNYKEIANPFYRKTIYDGFIKNITFYNNMIVVKKGINNNEKLSYE